MAIWKYDVSIEELNQWAVKDMTGRMGMEYSEIGDDYLRARIPVDARTTQVYGLWHGGASCVVAEAMGSLGCTLCVDRDIHYCVGVEINASHMRSATEGYVAAETRPLFINPSMHAWETRFWNDYGKLMCVSRLTTAILER